MTADARPRRSPRAWILAALAALFGAHASASCSTHCDGGECTDSSEARLLDRVCAQSFPEGPACEVGAGAAKSTGITADTTGFLLDDAGGILVFHLAALDGVRSGDTFDVEILAASTLAEGSQLETRLSWGSCAQGCLPDPNPFVSSAIPPQYTWFPVVLGQPSAQTTGLPYDAVLSLKGKSIDIADIRVSSITPEFACSLARPPGAR